MPALGYNELKKEVLKEIPEEVFDYINQRLKEEIRTGGFGDGVFFYLDVEELKNIWNELDDQYCWFIVNKYREQGWRVWYYTIYSDEYRNTIKFGYDE